MSISSPQFVILGLAAFVLTGLLTWPVRALAIRLGAMDAPNLARKTQKEPVPYLGGLAIALGITIITFAAVFVGGNTNGENNGQLKDLALTALLPALGLGAMGLIDDLRSLSPWPRLIMQTVVGTVVAFLIVENGTIGTAFGETGSSSWINTAATIFWIVGICNSINFFDNLDGAASGAVAIAALGVFLIAFGYSFHFHLRWSCTFFGVSPVCQRTTKRRTLRQLASKFIKTCSSFRFARPTS
jgi:UDP-GlcNAc:undecaprenyl-phosphate GlcNAc-1-phosphate transferase